MEGKKIAAAYIRVSTDDQTELSPESQLKEIIKYAKAHKMILKSEHIYRDDGISGRSTIKRSGFNAMIAAAKSNPSPFNVILVWKYSRFARNQEESIVYKSLLRKNGIEVLSISEPIFDSPFGSLIERIIEWMDEYYSVRLSGEVKRGMKEKISRGGVVSNAPFGYDVINGEYVPNDDADTVKNIFCDYMSGMGFISIAKKYSDLGVRTRNGNPLDNRFVEYVLHNPIYIGKVRWSPNGRSASKGKYDDPSIITANGCHAPIIDEKLFYDVQDKMQSDKKCYAKYQRREQPVNFMLKGLVRCSDCGSTLVYRSAKEPGVQCHNYNRGICRVSHYISLKKLNKAVITALESSYFKGTFNIERRIDRRPSADYSRAIELEQRKLNRIKSAYYSGSDTLEEYAENKKTILLKIAQLKAEKEKSNNYTVKTDEFRRKIASVLDIVKGNCSEEAKNRALRAVIDRIVFDRKASSVDIFFYV